MECFIYAITNTVTGRRYIGSCVKVKRRFGEHRSSLKCNRHHCDHLQNSYNKHGKENFTFSIIRMLPTNDRRERSIAELAEIAKAPCFNSLQAQTDLQFFTSSEEIKLKISESGKKRYRDNPSLAQRHSEKLKALYSDPEARKRTAAHTRAAYTPEIRQLMSEKAKTSWKSGTRKARPIRIPSQEELISKSERMKKYWATPESLPVKARQKAAVQAYWTSEAREQKARQQTGLKQSDEAKKKKSESLKKAWSNPTDAMKTIPALASASWTDPVIRQLRLEKMRAAWVRRKARGDKPCQPSLALKQQDQP